MSYNHLYFEQFDGDKEFSEFLEFYQIEYRKKVLSIDENPNNSITPQKVEKKRILISKQKLKTMLVKFFATEYYDSSS